MPRQNQYLHAPFTPVTPLDAATVLLLRDAPQPGGGTALEVLMTRRSDKASFVPGAHVFPGGGIEAQDAGA
jgi:recombination protein RecT